MPGVQNDIAMTISCVRFSRTTNDITDLQESDKQHLTLTMLGREKYVQVMERAKRMD